MLTQKRIHICWEFPEVDLAFNEVLGGEGRVKALLSIGK